MTDTERHEIIGQLREGMDALTSAVAGLPASDATRRPAPDRWTILECVEHVALVESFLLQLIADQSRSVESPGPGRETSYLRHSTNRKRRFNAPAAAVPTGRFARLEDALEAFHRNRNATIRYIEQVQDDLRGRNTLHPVAGDISCRECLALLIGHPLRHIEQIREIQSACPAQ
jgi:hypothetical protein